MDKERLVSFSLGPFSTNAYLLINNKLNEAVLIDAPFETERLVKFIKERHLNLKGVILTHGHIDHIAGLSMIGAPFYIHTEDKEFLNNPDLNLSSLLCSSICIDKEPIVLNEGKLFIDSFNIDVLHTPGHTPGSISLVVYDCLFSGDTLFFDSIGRTDIPLASHGRLLDSIKKKILPLDKRMRVYPGHGPPTTIKREKEHNPFLC